MIDSLQKRPLRFDILRVPLLGRFLVWKHGRTLMQSLLFVLAAIMIVDGLLVTGQNPGSSSEVAKALLTLCA